MKPDYRSIAIVLILIIIFGYGAKVVYSTYDEKLREVTQRNEQLERKKELIAEIGRQKNKLRQLDEYFLQGNASDFREAIETAAATSGIGIVSMRGLQSNAAQGYTEMNVHLQLRGDYLDFFVFLRDLEAQGGLYVQRLTMKKRSSQKGIEADLTVLGLVRGQ